MAEIHRTTMTPTKLELLADWLPRQPWYVGAGDVDQLAQAGGFRLDDPAGEVGVELMIVTDTSGVDPAAYHVPMTYRSDPPDDDAALIGTSEHGVLGRRWISDGAHDPVFLDALLGFLRGDSLAQHRTQSDTLDPRYAAHLDVAGLVVDGAPTTSPDGTDIALRDAAGSAYVLRVVRRIGTGADLDHVGSVTGVWSAPDGNEGHGALVVVHG